LEAQDYLKSVHSDCSIEQSLNLHADLSCDEGYVGVHII